MFSERKEKTLFEGVRSQRDEIATFQVKDSSWFIGTNGEVLIKGYC